MKVLYIATECKPFSQVGGVGDVAGELPAALKEQGVDIEIVVPWYGRTQMEDYEIEFQGRSESVGLVVPQTKGVPIHFVKNRTYFETDYSVLWDGSELPFKNPYLFKKDYSTPYVVSNPIPYYDDALRFSFFSRACVSLIEKLTPDIVHVNDWGLGFLLGDMLLRNMRPKRVMTIHNICYQGNVSQEYISGWDMERFLRDPELGFLFTDWRDKNSVNPMRLGLEVAHQVNTVSPTYKQEITQPEDPFRYLEGGKGLDAVTRRLDSEGRLSGILNGFEYQQEATKAHFEELLAEKARMKAELAKDFPKGDSLLLGFVGRAAEQKIKLLLEKLASKPILEHILDMENVNVAFVATGEPYYEWALARFQDRPNFSATLAFDKDKARQVYLGCDVFLMPSLFEPCGISQMESLSLATPPLVHWTGGLVDTIKPHTQEDGTGFGFSGSTKKQVLENLLGAVQQAFRMYSYSPPEFREMQWRGYQQRFLWRDSAKRYIADVYEPALKER